MPTIVVKADDIHMLIVSLFLMDTKPECAPELIGALVRYFGALLIKNGFDPATGMRAKGPSAVQ